MSTEYKDYYKILGVERAATPEEINKAYKKLARKYHPDLNSGDKGAEDKFKEVNEANDVLKDPEKRKMYDHLGSGYAHGQRFQRPQDFGGFGNFNMGNMGGFGASGYSDFFETLFGGGGFAGASQGGFSGFGGRPTKGKNIESDLSITLEEAYSGIKKSLSVNASGASRTLEVNIPAGVAHGAKIRLAGQGHAANNAPAGDLILHIKVLPHEQFTLEGNDIFYDLHLTPWEAALGTKAIAPTLDGRVELNVAAGTAGGKKLRLKGRGLGQGSKQGDLFVLVQIGIPAVATDAQKEAWEGLKAAYKA